MKAIWSGTLSFGLVNIPIQLYSAIQAHTFGFRLLHEKCHTPLEYYRWCSRCKKEIDWENTVKGLEQDDGTFFVFTKEALEEYKPKKSDAIAILSFVNKEEIKPIYLENHYYIAPEKKGSKPFFLFQKALADSGKVAIGTFVMREKEYICSINPHESGLLLNTLNYAYEIRPMKEIATLENVPKLSKEELRLAKQLIDQLTKKTFDLAKFKDTFAEQLTKAIKTKKKRKPKKEPAKKEKAPKKKDLVSILQESLKTPAAKEQPAYAKAKR